MNNIVLWLFLATPKFDYGDPVTVNYGNYINCKGVIVDDYCTEERCLYSVQLKSCPDKELKRRITLHGLEERFIERNKQ